MPQIKSVENQANITICLCTYLPIADSTVFFFNHAHLHGNKASSRGVCGRESGTILKR